ncbi:MAG: hypothetical protein WDZ49_00090, partial [Litorilinea sp.]
SEAHSLPTHLAGDGSPLAMVAPESQNAPNALDILPPAIAKQLEPVPAPDANADSQGQMDQSDAPTADAENANRPAETEDNTQQDSTPEDSTDDTSEVTPDSTPDETTPSPPGSYRLPLFHVQYFEDMVAPLRTLTTPSLAAITMETGQADQWTVAPDSAFSRVVVTLEGATPAGESINAETLADLRIWVVSPEGLRRIEAGMAPAQAAVTGFTALRLGRDQSVLQASFDAVGHAPYTVIVENRGSHTATFDMTVRNGLLRLQPEIIEGATDAATAQ